MTIALATNNIAEKIRSSLPSAVLGQVQGVVLIDAMQLLDVCKFLEEDPELDLNYLNYITAVDCYDYFELTYLLTSLNKNHAISLKTRVYDRENPALPSLTGLWRGADFQEREIFDLMGINFEGHPNMKRIFLWEGFKRHPQRKDYLQR